MLGIKIVRRPFVLPVFRIVLDGGDGTRFGHWVVVMKRVTRIVVSTEDCDFGTLAQCHNTKCIPAEHHPV